MSLVWQSASPVPFVGAGVPDGPPSLAPHSLQKPCHCEGAARPWQSASPVPKALLPKGGWHGEAVTGGFRSPLHPL